MCCAVLCGAVFESVRLRARVRVRVRGIAVLPASDLSVSSSFDDAKFRGAEFGASNAKNGKGSGTSGTSGTKGSKDPSIQVAVPTMRKADIPDRQMDNRHID